MVWAERLYQPNELRTPEGRLLHVVFPGWRGGGPGPDFRDAVIALPDATLLYGDVEIHLTTQGWYTHGHSQDAHYERVVLHVVWNDAAPVTSGGGSEIHSVCLSTCLGLPVEELLAKPVRRVLTPGSSCPAPLGAVVEKEAARWLGLLGQQRILERADRYLADRLLVGGDEVMWRYLLRSLGYHQNTEAFWRLGATVPWKVAAHLVMREDGIERLEALLLGAAGFLDGDIAAHLAAGNLLAQWRWHWQELSCWLCGPRLSWGDWIFAGVRPENQPYRRLLLAARLAALYAPDLERGIVSEVFEREEKEFGINAMRKELRGATSLAHLGAGRAREIVVNVMLPAALALERDGGPEKERLWAILERLGTVSDNSVTRHMRSTLGLRLHWERRVGVEQGLLHLYERWCREKRCGDCPVRMRQEGDVERDG
ncbi:MAG: DUF2851 family protein [Chloroflexi bacterium]|nr:DUF2851 family protein [Chloroflexota bacterium]